MISDYIWMDGELVSHTEAKIHVLSPTLHYGAGIFEGIRSYETPHGPAIFRLQDHLERFLDSILILGVLDFPYTIDEMRSAIHEIIRVNKFGQCYIRPLMYLDGPLNLNIDNSIPRVAIAAWEWGPYLGEEAQKTGIHMKVSSLTRLHPNISMTKSKITGNYVNSMIVNTHALRSGYDEAVILDPSGFVAECTGENIFMVREGVIYTPPRASILEGITRDSVISLANDMGIPVVEEVISRDQLYIADEVFITGTAAEIVPVRMIDYRPVADGFPGPVMKALLASYLETVHGKGKRSEEWLDYLSFERKN
ncbi:MAG: branched-chain amino acid transaminase [Chloroflexota bacterium]|nr:MAG: branched-chain amino acid transaminase [Chloroflexota bacterium]